MRVEELLEEQVDTDVVVQLQYGEFHEVYLMVVCYLFWLHLWIGTQVHVVVSLHFAV